LDFFEEAAEIVEIVIAELLGNGSYALVGLIEQLAGFADFQLKKEDHGGKAGAVLKEFAIARFRLPGTVGERLERERLVEVTT